MRAAGDRAETIVIDRFFDTQQKAIAWAKVHPYFITVRILTPDSNEGAKLGVSKDRRSRSLLVALKQVGKEGSVISITFEYRLALLKSVTTHVTDFLYRSFDGEQMMLTWNAVRQCSSHRTAPFPPLKTDCGSSADLRVMFAFFSNRLGCIGSLIVSVVGSLVLILVLRGCGAF